MRRPPRAPLLALPLRTLTLASHLVRSCGLAVTRTYVPSLLSRSRERRRRSRSLTLSSFAARSVSATARSTIDSCRVIGIWAVSLFLGWESFKLLQVVGCVPSLSRSPSTSRPRADVALCSFALLCYGTFVFNGITSFPHWTGLHRDALPAGSPPASPPFRALSGHGGAHADDDVEPIDHYYDQQQRQRQQQYPVGEQAPLLPKRAVE